MSVERFIHRIIDQPALCFSITTLIIIVTINLALQVEKNTTPYFLDRLHAERVKEDVLAETFLRSKETIMLVLKAKEGDIFTADAISLLKDIHLTLGELDLLEHANKNQQIDKNKSIQKYNVGLADSKTIEEVERLEQTVGQYLFPIRNIKSLLNSDDIFMDDDEITVAPNFSNIKLPAWNQNEGKQVLKNPLLIGSLLNEDGTATSVHLELNIDTDDSDLTTALFNKIKSAVTPLVDASNFEVFFSGSPVVNIEISKIMEKDNKRYFPMIIGLITIILYILFGSLWAPLLSLSVAIITIISTFGLMYLLGITLNIVTTVLPIFIITIGVTDAIHVLSETEQNDGRISKNEAIILKVTKLFRAMLLTSITTALGFFSLSYTEISNIRDFGIMVGISSLIAFVVSVTVLPAMMSKINFRPSTSSRPFRLFSLIEQLAMKQTPKKCFALISLLVFFAAAGSSLFYVDQQNLNSFSAHSKIRYDDKMINQVLGGTVPVNIWLKSEDQNGVLTPEVLRVIEQFEHTAKQHDIVGYTVSIAGFIQQINDVLFPENKSAAASSLSREMISQYLFLLESGPSRDLESVLEIGQYNETRIVIMSRTDGSKDLQVLLDDLTEVAKSLPASVSYQFAGYGNMNAVAAGEIVNGQLSSIFISVVGLITIISLIYRSLSLGLIAIFPLSMSLIVMFGIMGFLSIPLDIGSSLVCGIALGIGIDYSIHIIEAFKRNFTANRPTQQIIENALSEVSFPILTSAFTISAGFAILLFSEFQPIFNLGLLVSITMLISAFSTLFIVPILLSFTKYSTPIIKQ
jgi:predicted RND superfamily exporter protein